MGSTEQTKTGNLIIEGVLRLGQFTTVNAPSGVEGALYFDTTENTTKIYSSSAWGDLGGGWDGVLPNYTTEQRNALSLADGQVVYNTTDNAMQIYASGVWRSVGAKLSLATTCSLDGDCDSAHCVNGYCCDTGCTGNCDRCNVAGSIGTCTNVNSDCTGNCDICSSGNCVASVSLCTGNCDVCSGSGTAYSCAAVPATCTGNCDTCSGSGTAYSCAASASLCTGNCDICSGSGTAYNCAASDSLCTAVCTACTGSATAYSCTYVPAGSADNTCTATHYRCDGNGNCTDGCKAPPAVDLIVNSGTGTAFCAAQGYCSCYRCYAYIGGTNTNVGCSFDMAGGDPTRWCGCLPYLW